MTEAADAALALCGFSTCPGLVDIADLASSAAYSRDDREELETSWGVATLQRTLDALTYCRRSGCSLHRDHSGAIRVLDEICSEAEWVDEREAEAAQ